MSGFGYSTIYTDDLDPRANAALEEEMGSLPNGFSFVCPGILDSALMLSDGIAGREARLKHLTEWSISAEGNSWGKNDFLLKLTSYF